MRIIIVTDPKRKDFYQYIADRLKNEHELFILWEYKKTQELIDEYDTNIQPLYWSDYATPKQLLETVKPDKILFFEIIDLWQIPLIVVCHKFKITTFFIEHGVGNSVDLVVGRFYENPSPSKKVAIYLNKLIFVLPRVFKNRLFFLSATQYLPASELPKYFKIIYYLKKHTPIHALSHLKFRSRTPHYAILFNQNNIEPFLIYNEIERQNIITEGVPFFDKYFSQNRIEEDHIVFIDHPYLEEGILSWDNSFHEKVARTLEKFAVEKNVKIIVKLHPRSQISNWIRYNLNPLITIRQKEDITNEMLSAKIILGYSSTLINALIANKKNVVLLGWHPKPLIFGDDFSKTGLCHVSFRVEDLFERFNHWQTNNLTLNNKSNFENFIKEYNYPFDGKATERAIKAILNKNVSDFKEILFNGIENNIMR